MRLNNDLGQGSNDLGQLKRRRAVALNDLGQLIKSQKEGGRYRGPKK